MQNKKNVDKENLRQVILDAWKQFAVGVELAKDLKISGNFQSICVSGMGGSSLPADLLETYLAHLREKDRKNNKSLRVIKNRGYKLPPEAYENCLNIFISYSGNTEETLSSLGEALKNKLPSVGIAHGGKLIDVCKKNGVPTIIVPQVSQPRYATGYFFSGLLQIISNCGLIEKNFSREILASTEKLGRDTKKLEKKGQSLAEKMFKKTPLIHTTDRFKSVGRIGKIKINENAKTPCFYNYYPELNHNEMVGCTLPQTKFFVLTLLDKKEHPQMIKRMKITAGLLKEKDFEVALVDIPDSENMFLSVFSSLALLDWVSYYLALAYKQDPTPVAMVEDLKKKLK
jgi:glucose/mannose-6-phosphate isomerase